jgi:hypothetical protein
VAPFDDRLTATIVGAVLVVIGLLTTVFARQIRGYALRANESTRNWPILGYFGSSSLTGPHYLFGMRIAGVVVLLGGVVLVLMMLRTGL